MMIFGYFFTLAYLIVHTSTLLKSCLYPTSTSFFLLTKHPLEAFFPPIRSIPSTCWKHTFQT